MIKGIDYPEWYSQESLDTVTRGYVLENETPKQMYQRVAKALSNYLPPHINANHYEKVWFNYMWKGWLSPASPVLSNVGTNRGLGISCYLLRVDDTTLNIFDKVTEMSILTKFGGGIGVDFGKIRGRGEPISKGGFTEGIVPFLKVYDSAILATSQAGVRRGAMAAYLPIRHKDTEEFLHIREPKGDINRQCLNLNHAISVDDVFMEKLELGDSYYRELWAEILKLRMETGQPYIMYYDNVNRANPECYKQQGFKVNQSNLCSEIVLYTDPLHTAVCCLSSLNISKWDEWKTQPDFIFDSVLFLDCLMEDFIQKGGKIKGFENAVRFAKKSRPLALGVLGWHTYLQSQNIPFISFGAKGLINKIGTHISEQVQKATKHLGSEFGVPEWCVDTRNSHCTAIAPTTTNSLIQGGVSQGIEPIVSNYFVQKSAKGTFIRKNPQFQNLIETKYPQHNTQEMWTTVRDAKGSIQHLQFLTDAEKEVFLTAYEINQLELVKSVGVWQKYIDQAISTNLFFPADVPSKWVNQVHLEAWKQKLKTLYYIRTESIASRTMKSDTFSDCVYCEA